MVCAADSGADMNSRSGTAAVSTFAITLLSFETWTRLKWRIKAARTPDMVAMCSREQASSLCSRDLGECSGGVPGGVGVAALSFPAAEKHICLSRTTKKAPLASLAVWDSKIMHRSVRSWPS